MKKLILTLTFILPLAASASSEKLWEALNVTASSVAAPRTQLVYRKSVGGLDCLKINDISSGTSYSCKIQLGAVDALAVFDALNIEAQPLAADRMTLVLQKQVGELTCVKRNHLRDGMSATCELSF